MHTPKRRSNERILYSHKNNIDNEKPIIKIQFTFYYNTLFNGPFPIKILMEAAYFKNFIF